MVKCWRTDTNAQVYQNEHNKNIGMWGTSKNDKIVNSNGGKLTIHASITTSFSAIRFYSERQ